MLQCWVVSQADYRPGVTGLHWSADVAWLVVSIMLGSSIWAMTNGQHKRVVSLIASATDIVCALGARDLLVGRSHECDFPPDLTRLPSLTDPKFPLTGTSYELDARVKAILQEGLSVYRVDAEKLQALRPDIIITQDHCEVCAVSLKDVEAALCAWSGRQVEVVSLKPNALADIWEDIAKVARALECERQGER